MLFPVSPEIIMRPLTSSSLPIEGMLLVTFVSRRGDQIPPQIITACTGTLRSFAYGDFAKLRIPCRARPELSSAEPGFALAHKNIGQSAQKFLGAGQHRSLKQTSPWQQTSCANYFPSWHLPGEESPLSRRTS